MRRVVEVVCCGITETGADAVVNASNSDAVLGGGVSRALFDECGGDFLQREMKEKLDEEFDGELDADACLVTSGGSSGRIRFVLHVPSVDYRTRSTTSVERVAVNVEAALRAAATLAEKKDRSASRSRSSVRAAAVCRPASRSRPWSTGCGRSSGVNPMPTSRALYLRCRNKTGSRSRRRGSSSSLFFADAATGCFN